MHETPTLYFKNASEWRAWLHENHSRYKAVHLIFYKVAHEAESMRWEEAVKVAICYGWIDSTVRKLDKDRRQQLFTPRKDKSIWSKINKGYIEDLIAANLMHESGLKKIETAKKNGSWESLDAVEKLEIPENLQQAFAQNPVAFSNYENFSKSYKKSYLYWLNQAKRPETRQARINQIIDLCERNCKMR